MPTSADQVGVVRLRQLQSPLLPSLRFTPSLAGLRRRGAPAGAVPWGQSGHPDSPHYVDQAEKLYSKREMKNTWWKKADLLDHVESEKAFRWPRK